MEAIVIKRDTNIQDGVVIHSKAGAAVTIVNAHLSPTARLFMALVRSVTTMSLLALTPVFNAVIGETSLNSPQLYNR